MTRPFSSPSGRYWDWARIVKTLRKTPGKWHLIAPGGPNFLVKHVRKRRHDDLVLTDGVVEAQAVNPYRNVDGNRRADIYMRFVPKEDA